MSVETNSRLSATSFEGLRTQNGLRTSFDAFAIAFATYLVTGWARSVSQVAVTIKLRLTSASGLTPTALSTVSVKYFQTKIPLILVLKQFSVLLTKENQLAGH